jgi:hypothetical protein
MLLSTGIIKLASITQNNHVYEHTAEGLTSEVSLNIRSPYWRQKRDSIIRSSFRRPYTGIEIPTINTITFLSITSTIFYFSTFLRCDYTDYLIFLTTISTISYFPTFLRSYRLFFIFLLSCGHIDYLLPTYISLTSRKQPILAQLIRTALNLPCLGMVNHPANQIRVWFPMPRHDK